MFQRMTAALEPWRDPDIRWKRRKARGEPVEKRAEQGVNQGRNVCGRPDKIIDYKHREPVQQLS